MTDWNERHPDEQGRNMGGSDHPSDRCMECGQRGHVHHACTTEPWPPPLEPRRPTLRQAFALDDAVIQLDMGGKG